MNTLSKEKTARFFATAEDYQRLRAHWRELMNSPRKHQLGPQHHLLYLALLGKDWRKAFTRCTNPRKLANGALSGWSMWRALNAIRWATQDSDWAARLLAPFDDLITFNMIRTLNDMLPEVRWHHYKPEDFANGYPFDAYRDEAAAP